ncbi:prepilin peptidase-dependent pilin [Acerihabitans sp. TG2]|uniref:prepilin peptidase-dependent pilin n=1 Tax=Acerihabitans sp. TG2 TaxID=3096008 RepID=UPI002B23A17D|nr:prepilin peptidase-dependent pilin [Acerihabitans sp. TG2]MEA9391800.1 prepilin peptidase-dependent pilin [Acerihabitans sp. TG2]
MNNQQGFTLVELMVVMAIIATLSAIGLPGYQRYLDRAAMTEMLHMLAPYKSSVELCALQHDGLTACQTGQSGIPEGLSSRYVDRIEVRDGVIDLLGRQALRGLTLTLTPSRRDGGLRWSRACRAEQGAQHLIAPCQALFRFNHEQGESA